MPWLASFKSTLKVAPRSNTQAPTGEFLPASVNWSTITGVPCRIFPATESELQRIWGQSLNVDAICWVNPNDVANLPVEVLTGGSGAAIPVQVTDEHGSIEYMCVSARDLAHFGKVKALALKRFFHG